MIKIDRIDAREMQFDAEATYNTEGDWLHSAIINRNKKQRAKQ